MNKGTSRARILAVIASSLFGSSMAVADNPRTVTVDCSSGKTLAKALERGNEDRALIVVVQGVCNETVVIERSDVTLRGESGAAINGPNPAVDAVTVRADRVTIENLVVSGGRNGIVASGAGNLMVRGVTVQSTGRTGILVLWGSGAIVDGSTLQFNPRDGLSSEGSQVTIMNSTVRQNARIGVFIGIGMSGRIGLDNANNAAGNTITQNGASGITVTTGGSAIIGNNSITQNGADLASTSGRSGISVTAASADIVGGNTIADNTGQGIFLRGASVQIGNQSFAFSSVNTITGNGDALSAGGVFALLGSTVVIRDAVISGNRGFGLGLTGRSQAQVFNSQFNDNVPAGPNLGDGVRVALGSAVLFNTPNSGAAANAGWGLLCTDLESSVVNTPAIVLAGNAIPGTNCTGF